MRGEKRLVAQFPARSADMVDIRPVRLCCVKARSCRTTWCRDGVCVRSTYGRLPTTALDPQGVLSAPIGGCQRRDARPERGAAPLMKEAMVVVWPARGSGCTSTTTSSISGGHSLRLLMKASRTWQVLSGSRDTCLILSNT